MQKLMRSCGTNEPDLTQCRTSRVGTVIPGANRWMYYCKIDNAECKYAMQFGFDYICKHPDNHGFLMPEDEAPGFGPCLFAFAVG